MTRRRERLISAGAIVFALAAAAAVPLGAQVIEAPNIRIDTWGSPAVRIGQDYALRAGDTARQVVVIGGDATIDGRVDQDVVVVLGRVQLGSTAEVDGSFVVVGGTAAVAEGAQVHGDMFVLGGFEGASSFSPGGQYVSIGTAGLGRALRGIVPWIVSGLLLGRPIVPSLPWIWMVAAFFFLLNLGINALFDAPVRACATTMRATPMSAFMTGLLVLLLFGPVCVLLAVSVIGIAVVPFVACALLFAALIGRVGFARWIGISVAGQDDPASRLESLRSFLIGSAVMCVAYMIPILGFVTWTLAGVFGVGAATLAFFSAYRRENPKRPKAPRVPAPAAAPAAPAVPAVAAATGADPASAPYASGEHDGQPAYGAAAAVEPSIESPMADAADVPPQSPYDAAAAVPPIGGAGLLSFPRAAFGERLAALVLDVIVILIAVQVLGLDRHVDGPFGRGGMLVALIYHVAFWTWRGTTLGGIICQLRVVRTDGRPLGFAEALIRGLTGFFSLIVMGLGFLWILRDPERQSWHDRVAGTYVVKVPRSYPI